jgi:hypothetical protein
MVAFLSLVIWVDRLGRGREVGGGSLGVYRMTAQLMCPFSRSVIAGPFGPVPSSPIRSVGMA